MGKAEGEVGGVWEEGEGEARGGGVLIIRSGKSQFVLGFFCYWISKAFGGGVYILWAVFS